MGVQLGRGGNGVFSFGGRGGTEVYFTFQRSIATDRDGEIIGFILSQTFSKQESDICDINENLLLGNEAIVFHASTIKRALELAERANEIIVCNGASLILPEHMTFAVR